MVTGLVFFCVLVIKTEVKSVEMLVRVRTSKKGAANAVKEDPPPPLPNVVRLSCGLEKGRVGNQKSVCMH
jgi:hypothetical protein